VERWSPRRDLPGPIASEPINVQQPCVTSSVSTLSSLPPTAEHSYEEASVVAVPVSSGPTVTFPDSDDDNEL